MGWACPQAAVGSREEMEGGREVAAIVGVRRLARMALSAQACLKADCVPECADCACVARALERTAFKLYARTHRHQTASKPRVPCSAVHVHACAFCVAAVASTVQR